MIIIRSPSILLKNTRVIFTFLLGAEVARVNVWCVYTMIFFDFPSTSTTKCTITRPCTLRSLARSGYLIFKLDNPPIKIGAR
jgi:hypothetical protein